MDTNSFKALNDLGIEEEEVEQFIAQRDRGEEGKKYVCICGHAMNKHSETAGSLMCVTAKHYCPCLHPIAVLNVQDTRYFMTKTYGFGRRHALATGLYRLGRVGKWAIWLEKPYCHKCGSEGHPILPTAIDEMNRAVERPAIRNVLLCVSCLEQLGGMVI
jgi:hypothetical protein